MTSKSSGRTCHVLLLIGKKEQELQRKPISIDDDPALLPIEVYLESKKKLIKRMRNLEISLCLSLGLCLIKMNLIKNTLAPLNQFSSRKRKKKQATMYIF